MRHATLCVLIGLWLPACGNAFTLYPPANFMVLEEEEEDSRYSFTERATSAQGVVISVREIDNEEPHGSLSFWTEAIRIRLRRAGGSTRHGATTGN